MKAAPTSSKIPQTTASRRRFRATEITKRIENYLGENCILMTIEYVYGHLAKLEEGLDQRLIAVAYTDEQEDALDTTLRKIGSHGEG